MADDIIKKLQKLNPIENKIEIPGGSISWKIDPKLNFNNVLENPTSLFSNIGKSKIKIHLKEAITDDVSVDFIVDGKPEVFTEAISQDDLILEFNLQKKFVEQDVTINLNIKGSPLQIISAPGEQEFKIVFGVKIKI